MHFRHLHVYGQLRKLVVHPFRHTFIKTILMHCFCLAVNVESSTTDRHVQRKTKVACTLYIMQDYYTAKKIDRQEQNRKRAKQIKNKEQRTAF